jgi:hypothetical protein
VPNPGRSSCEIRIDRPFLREGSSGFGVTLIHPGGASREARPERRLTDDDRDADDADDTDD